MGKPRDIRHILAARKKAEENAEKERLIEIGRKIEHNNYAFPTIHQHHHHHYYFHSHHQQHMNYSRYQLYPRPHYQHRQVTQQPYKHRQVYQQPYKHRQAKPHEHRSSITSPPKPIQSTTTNLKPSPPKIADYVRGVPEMTLAINTVNAPATINASKPLRHYKDNLIKLCDDYVLEIHDGENEFGTEKDKE